MKKPTTTHQIKKVVLNIETDIFNLFKNNQNSLVDILKAIEYIKTNILILHNKNRRKTMFETFTLTLDYKDLINLQIILESHIKEIEDKSSMTTETVADYKNLLKQVDHKINEIEKDSF